MVYYLRIWKRRKKTVRLNNVILTEVKVKSINWVSFRYRASNKFICDAIRLGAVYVYDKSHDDILKTIF